jgi:hypothetical protein
MKTILMFGAVAFLLTLTLTGCVVVPAEPVVYASPPPPAVVVRPAYRHHYHGHGRYYRRGWR